MSYIKSKIVISFTTQVIIPVGGSQLKNGYRCAYHHFKFGVLSIPGNQEKSDPSYLYT